MIQSLTPPKTYARFRPRHAHIWRALHDICGLSPSSVVVDIGCGPGNEARAFIESGIAASYVGVDNALATIKAARDECRDSETTDFICCDATALPFSNDSIALATYFISLHQIASPAHALSEAHRVLGNNGCVAVLIVPESAWANALEFDYFPTLHRIEQLKSGSISSSTATNLLLRHGFRNVQTRTESYWLQHANGELLSAWTKSYFSTLTKLPAEEYQRGVDRLRNDLAKGTWIEPRNIYCLMVIGQK